MSSNFAYGILMYSKKPSKNQTRIQPGKCGRLVKKVVVKMVNSLFYFIFYLKYLTSFSAKPTKQVSMNNILHDQKKWFRCRPTAKETQHVLMFPHLFHEFYFIQESPFFLFACTVFNRKQIVDYYYWWVILIT